MPECIAIIPARSGSKGVPNKNIKLLAGKPLIAYSIAAATKVDSIDRVIVSTDSQKYANIAIEYGAEVPFLRPQVLADDKSTAFDFVNHALEWFKAHENSLPSYLAILLPTTPLRETHHIELAIKKLQSSDLASSLRSVHEMPETAYKTVEVDGGFLRCICGGSFNIDSVNGPRQSYPITYQPNGYIEVVRSDFVLENKRLFGDRTIPYITPPVVEVDSPQDFKFLEFQATANQELVNSLFRKA